MKGTKCTKPTLKYWNTMREGMNLNLKVVVSNFEPCVACKSFVTICVKCNGYIWIEPLEEDIGGA